MSAQLVLDNATLSGDSALDLISISTHAFRDDAQPGDVLAVIEGMPSGAVASAWLADMPTLPTPPADALVVEGNFIKAGPAFASLPTATGLRNDGYVLRVLVTKWPEVKFNETDCTICSVRADGPDIPVVPVSNSAALNSALSTAYGVINNAGAGFKGYVIELDPFGTFTDPLVLAPPNVGQQKKLVIRTGGANKLSGRRARVPQVQVLGGSAHLFVQRIEAVLTFANEDPLFRGGSPGSVHRFTTFYDCRAKGGLRVWDSATAWRFDPDQDIDPQSPWLDFTSAIYPVMSGGKFTRLDVYRGQDLVIEQGVPSSSGLGIWKVLDIPAYIGGHPDHDNTIVDLFANNAGSGTGFAGRIKRRWLTANTTPAKPATIFVDGRAYPAPDAIYLTEIVLDAEGSGYASSGTLDDYQRPNVRWPTQINGIDNMSQGFSSNSSVGLAHSLKLIEFEAADLSRGIRPNVNAAGPVWLIACTVDRIAQDFYQIRFDGPHTGEQIALLDWFNRAGRGISDRRDVYGVHADGKQYFGVNGIIVRIDHRGFLMDVYGSRGDQIQGNFGTDLGVAEVDNVAGNAVWAANSGFRVVTHGASIRCSNSNGFVFERNEQSVHYGIQVNSNVGSAQRLRGQHVGALLVYDKMIAQANTDWLATRYVDAVLTPAGGMFAGSGIYADYRNEWSIDPQVVAQRYKAVGIADGYGAFSDQMQRKACNFASRVCDPNMAPKFARLRTVVDAPKGQLVRSGARQNFYGTLDDVLDNFSPGLSVAIASTAAELAAAPSITAGPVSVPPEWEWEARITSSPIDGATITPTFTLNGRQESWTIASLNDLATPAGGDPANVARINFTSPTTNQQTLSLISSLVVPDGSAVLALYSQDSSQVPFLIGADLDWQELYKVGSSSVSGSAWYWFNDTGAPVEKSLQINVNNSGDQGAARIFVIPRTDANTRLLAVRSGTLQGGSNSAPNPQPASFPNDVAIRAFAVAVAHVDNAPASFSIPAGYGNGANINNGNVTNAASVIVADRMLTTRVASEDPGLFGIDIARPWLAATILVYAVPL